MSLARVRGLRLSSAPEYAGRVSQTINAVGESCAIIGQVYLAGGSGSKTLSSAGGAIATPCGSVQTFASGSTNLRIGIQDVSLSTGLEDGTFDVQADLVGGIDTIPVNNWRNTPMESGTKTLAHGDLVAVVVEMTARGGVDSVAMFTYTNPIIQTGALIFPYATLDTGAGPVKTQAVMPIFLTFDDGTYGWIQWVDRLPPAASVTAVTINTGTTPDEIAAVFKLAFRCEIDGLGIGLNAVASGDDFELIVYSDPFGSPVASRTVAPDTDTQAAAVQLMERAVTPMILEANTYYGFAVRATTANSFDVAFADYGSGLQILKAALPFTELKHCGRSDQTGPFSEIQSYYLPLILLDVCRLEDGGGQVGRMNGGMQ